MFESKIEQIDIMLLNKAFNGAVLVAFQDNILMEKGYGFADFELDVPNSPQTIFRIGSITKTITAVAILQLVERGLLHLQDKLNKFIPDYPFGEVITIHHLLTHTSGISNFELDSDFYDAVHASSFSEKLIDMFKYLPLQFSPGKDYSYSVSGYFLLGYIIENLTGLSYEDYLKQNIFFPLKMSSTGFDHYQPIIKGRARGYEMNGQNIRNADFVDMRIAGGGGGLYSTVNDLYLFHKGLLNHKIMKKESYMLMTTTHIKINDQTDYGYGLFLEESEMVGKIRHKNYHTGGGPGVRSILAHYKEDELLCIMITNVNNRGIFNTSYAELEDILLAL